jgi:malate dehydrogenase (oxaloacetate-decarboxylating)
MFMAYGVKEMCGVDRQPAALYRLAGYGGTPLKSLEELMEHCNIIIATTGVPDLIKPEMIRKGQVILALSNPKPEIDPVVAVKAGAAYAADGRSVNNVLGFPGIFRGVLNAGAKKITHEMLVAAAQSIADCTAPGELAPHPLDPKVHVEVARAVERVASQQRDEN